jgi:hypothetical protein
MFQVMVYIIFVSGHHMVFHLHIRLIISQQSIIETFKFTMHLNLTMKMFLKYTDPKILSKNVIENSRVLYISMTQIAKHNK